MSLEPYGDGHATVERDGESFQVADRFEIEPGDLIITHDAQARLQLAGLRSALIGPGSEVRIGGESRIELSSGNLLVETVERVSVDMDDIEAYVRGGRFRIDRLPAFEAASTYEGVLTLRGPGQEPVTVPPLFQSAVIAGEVLPAGPYELDVDDPWDRLYLDRIVELDERLKRFSSALTTQLDSAAPNLDRFLRAVPVSDVSSIEPYVGNGRRPAPDLFIAAAIALNDTDRTFAMAFERSFELRDDGGEWGIVAGIMEVPNKGVLVSLEELVVGSNILNPLAPAGSSGAGPDDSLEGAAANSAAGRSCTTLIDCLLDLPPAGAGGSGLP